MGELRRHKSCCLSLDLIAVQRVLYRKRPETSSSTRYGFSHCPVGNPEIGNSQSTGNYNGFPHFKRLVLRVSGYNSIEFLLICLRYDSIGVLEAR